ncbi:MAG: glycoside hydrolase family 127 protein [Alistipes sp.]|jgi:DUF1680 family protein|nr:glycoside hydrolase family 127 protein [Alistipes sp.]
MKKNRLIIWNIAAIAAMFLVLSCASDPSDAGKNIAMMATGTMSQEGSDRVQQMASLSDDAANTDTGPVRRRADQTPIPLQNSVIEYEWAEPVRTGEIELFWWNWEGSLALPRAYSVSWWNGSEFVPVTGAAGLGLVVGQYNTTTFDEVETTRLRLDVEAAQQIRQSLLEWRVFQAPDARNLTPIVSTNGDRTVMLGAETWLSGRITSVSPVSEMEWIKVSGPGDVTFTGGDTSEATAVFSAPGEYTLAFTARKGGRTVDSELAVTVALPPAGERLDVVYTKNYTIDNPLWNDRAKALITQWIPWCISQIEDSSLSTGGLDNFIEAAKALKGQPHATHKGFVFSNAWVHQTIESMCIALMVDPRGDREMIAAQSHMKSTLERWIPIVLAAQESDGYLHTAYTLRDTDRWQHRWQPSQRPAHEGYVAGYFIESAINHYTMTDGADLRLYNAAKRLADCWVANIGPEEGKTVWWDEHQEMEQALVRFGRFVNDMEGGGNGDRYIALAKFLLDSRSGGNEYSQSHVVPTRQYEAVGHAVRAVYTYSAMSDIAAETRDPDYQGAVMSIWDNLVNKKYYVTGGVGSGDTSEGFGVNYALRNDAYCESCSSCGLVFFQHKLNLAYHDASYVDQYEETMYNALLGSMSMDGRTFWYQNPLTDVVDRYGWHNCPCCVGNIPRTLLMIPTWTYVTSPTGIYVNMFIGSTINVERAVGTDVEMVQKTDYPWSGRVSITVNPSEDKEFTLYVRVPDRKTSELYDSTPAVSGLLSLSVNGRTVEPVVDRGYAAIKRTWRKGDTVDFELPMEVQRVTADERIEADRGKVALRYGPMIYNFEEVDNGSAINEGSLGGGALRAEWDPSMMGGMMVIRGSWADGKPMTAIPNYARMNRNPPRDPAVRTPRSNVWVGR